MYKNNYNNSTENQNAIKLEIYLVEVYFSIKMIKIITRNTTL